MPPNARGWTVELDHPTTGRTVRVETLTDPEPVFIPGPNRLPEARVPVRRRPDWLTDDWDDDPAMRVWVDGERLPIEALRNVTQDEGRTVLVGVGGVELEQRAQVEYSDDRRHLAARDLVENNTSYGTDMPAPDTETREDELQQSVDTDAEWIAALLDDESDTNVWGVDGGALRRRQTAYFADTDDLADVRGTESFEQTTYTYINGDIWIFDDAVQNGVEAGVEHTFNLDYQIPEGEAAVAVRIAFPVEDPENPGEALHQAYTQRIEGFDMDPIPADAFLFQDPPEWETHENANVPAVGPGSVDVEVKMTDDSSVPEDQEIQIDALMIYDARFPPTLIDEVTQDSDRKAQVDLYNGSSLVETADVRTAFSVAGARLDATVNDTSGDFRVGVSNDAGDTWTDATNATSVDADFADVSSRLRARFEVGAFEGETDDIVGQVFGQEVDAYDLFADIEQELLLIDETVDASIAEILTNRIADPAERSWAVTTDAGGNIQVEMVQNGQRVDTDADPDFSARQLTKTGKTYDKVTVKGSNQPVSGEPWTASATFTPLVRENILEGSETVVADDGTNFERGTDYEMRYADGEIRLLSGGDLTAGTEYAVDYQYRAIASYQPDGVTVENELVEEVPGVTSDRLAEQVAYVLQTDLDTPRYGADVTIPTASARFDPLAAYPPGVFGDLPAGIDALEPRGSPEVTPRGLRTRYGTRPETESLASQLAQQVARVSERS